MQGERIECPAEVPLFENFALFAAPLDIEHSVVIYLLGNQYFLKLSGFLINLILLQPKWVKIDTELI